MTTTTADRAATLREVQAAIRSNDLKAATEKALVALDAGVEHPMLLNLRALKLEEEGRAAEALADLQRARALAPGDYTVLNALGLCFARLERYAEAAQAFDAVVRLEPRFAPAHHNIGWLKDLAGDLAGARQAHETALQMNPAFVEASASLAMIAVREKDWVGARIHAEKALQANPRQPTAQTALAAIEVAQGDFASAETRLRLMLSGDTRLFLPQMLVTARGLWADALDGMGRAPDAFAAYQAEKREMARLHGGRFEGKPSLKDFTDWAGAWFTAADPWPVTETLAGGPPMLFIVGFPGSGVELLARMFEGRDGVTVMADRDAMAEGVRAFMGDEAALERLRDAGPDALAVQRQAYWKRVRELGFETKGGLFVDAAAMNLLKLPLIARLFPKARVLIARRDPRDVALAALRRHERGLNATGYELLSVDGAARFQAGALDLAQLYLDKLPLQAEMVRYEDLVADPAGVAARVSRFAGADLDAASLETPTPTPTTVDGWRAYAAPFAATAAILAPLVERLGYPAD
jgi:Flp pilus assembly protein TadD